MPSTLLDLAKRGRLKECARLLDGGADIEGRGLSQTPLEGAVVMGQTEVVRLLIERGADVHRRCNGIHRPLLTVASGNGDVEICHLLLGAGLPVNEVDDRGFSALHVAAFENQVDVIEVLLENGAAINQLDSTYETALHHAISGGGYVESCRALARHGLSPSICPEGVPCDYLTPIQYAMSRGREGVVRCFIEEFGAPIEQISLDGRTTATLVQNSSRMAAVLNSLRTAAAIGVGITTCPLATGGAAPRSSLGAL